MYLQWHYVLLQSFEVLFTVARGLGGDTQAPSIPNGIGGAIRGGQRPSEGGGARSRVQYILEHRRKNFERKDV